MHFVRFATMALTAELRRRVAGRAAWIVVAADEEHGLEHARDVANLACISGHAVLVVASGAVHGYGRPVKRYGADCEAIVKLELRELAACGCSQLWSPGADGDRAIPVVLAAAADLGQRSHGVIVLVVASGPTIIAEPRWSVTANGVRDHFDSLARHHSVLCEVAVVAAEAKHDNDRWVMRAGGHIRRCRDWVSTRVAKVKRLGVVRSNIRAPQRRIATGGIRRCDAIAPGAAVRRVTGNATSAINEVRAQNVRRRRVIGVGLSGSKRRRRQDPYEYQHDSLHD